MIDDSTIPEKMSGYELARKVLKHFMSTPGEEAIISEGGIDALLELSNDDENDWFELKAGMYPSPSDRDKGVTDEDVFWHNTKAVLGLMNASGGALIIGIRDTDHSVVPLRDNDPDHRITGSRIGDYLLNDVLGRISPSQDRSWKIKKKDKQKNTNEADKSNDGDKYKEIWTIRQAVRKNMLVPLSGIYQKEKIAVILVEPAERPVLIQNKNGVEHLFYRVPGVIGKVESRTNYEDIRSYIDSLDENRRIKGEKYAALYRRFLKKVESETEEARLNEKIENYYRRFEEDSKSLRAFALSSYTSLDASENSPAADSDNALMEPQAIELFENEDYSLGEENEEDDFGKNGIADEDIEEDDNPADRLNDDADDEARSGEEDDEGDGEEVHSLYREKRSGALLTLMQENPRIAILGEPGGGKTTTLTRFVMQFHRPEDKAQVLAVFIPLGQWSRGGSLLRLIKSLIGLTLTELQKLFESKRLRLVLDAVNECPDSYRKAMVLEIQHFLSDHPDLPVAISSRTNDDIRILHLPATFTVQPMDAAHQLNYLTSYLKDEEQAQSLQNRLLERPGGMEIASNPLLLWMVLDVFKGKGELPMRRADLYRSWIELWYVREQRKAKKAGEPLPWGFEKARIVFSELAFQSRRSQSYRDVPMEIVTPVLAKFGEDCVAKLCQGPVVSEEPNSIRFRHETFQEYFCAEYLIRHPDALPQLTKDDSAQWGMPLAYAAELLWPLPEPLWRAAWEIDPWFGFAVTDDARLELAKDLAAQFYNPFLLQVLSDCDFNRENDHFSISRAMISEYDGFWYWNSDQKLGYMVLTNEATRKRWLAIELNLLRKEYSVGIICSVLTRSIVLKQYAGHSIHQTFQNIWEAGKDLAPSSLETHLQAIEEKILTDRNLAIAIRLIQEGFASIDDCRDRLAFWIQQADVDAVDHIIKAGLATKDDFVHRLPYLIQKASITDADHLIAAGLAAKDDFRLRVPRWIRSARIVEAKQLIKAGFATKDDFNDRLPQWIRHANIRNVGLLIRSGLVTKDDFKDQIENLMNQVTNPKELSALINTGLVSKEDFEKKIQQWKTKADPKMAVLLAQYKWASKEDFKDRIEQWISKVDPQIAVLLIQNGLASKEDFKDRIDQWKSKADPQLAVFLIQNRLASKENFEGRIDQWKSKADPRMAVLLTQQKWASKEDFKDKIAQWVLKADSQTVLYLFQNDLVVKEDFKDRIEQWISEADPKKAAFLIRNDLVAKEDFREKIEQWIATADPQTAVLLTQYKWASKEDFKDKIEQWEMEGVPEVILFLYQNGLTPIEVFKDKIEQWISMADPQLAVQLINCKLASREDFKDKSQQWRLDFSYLPYRTVRLKDPFTCQAIKRDLRGKMWKLRMIYHSDFYSLFWGHAFPNTVFCLNSLLKGGPITAGSVWSAEVFVKYSKKRDSYGYCVKRAEYIPTGKEEEKVEGEELRQDGVSQTDASELPASDANQAKETKPANDGFISLGDILNDVLK